MEPRTPPDTYRRGFSWPEPVLSERCPSCLVRYSVEVEFRCVACDCAGCPHCFMVLRETREAWCPGCHGGEREAAGPEGPGVHGETARSEET